MTRIDSYTKLALTYKDGVFYNYINDKTYTSTGFIEDPTTRYFPSAPSFKATTPSAVMTIPSVDIPIGANPFTIEFFIKGEMTTFGNILSNGATGTNLIISTNASGLGTGGVDGEINVYPLSLNSQVKVLDNQWHHIALTKDSDNNNRLFVDGILKDSYVRAITVSTANFSLGTGYRTSFTSNFTDLNISVGVARYVANFTPPTSPTIEPVVSKLLFKSNSLYYYHNGIQWISLGSNLSGQDIEVIQSINPDTNQIAEFEGLYGKSWELYIWSDKSPIEYTSIKAIPIPQILTAKNSIQLTGVVSGTFKWIATGGSRVALSVDDGVTYYAYKNGVWIDATNDMSNAMTATEYTALTWEQYKLLAGDSNFLKHQYYIPDNSTVDDISITAELMGTNRIAPSTSYNLVYDQSTKTIRYQINKSGSYFCNYIDVATLY